jgi:hypothetical protein
MSETRKFKFKVTESLWELWKRLEEEGASSAALELEPSREEDYIEVEVVGGEASLAVPRWVHESEELMDIMEQFVTAYRGAHADWLKTFMEDEEAWVDYIMKQRVRRGLMTKEEAEEFKRKYLEHVRKEAEERARRFTDMSRMMVSLFMAREALERRKRRAGLLGLLLLAIGAGVNLALSLARGERL